MKKIYASQLEVGIRLPCDVYNEQGTLLWVEGSIVKNQKQIKKLVDEGYRSDLQEWIPPNTASRVTDDPEELKDCVKIKKVFVYATVIDALVEIQLPLNYIFEVFKGDSQLKEKKNLTAQVDAVVDVILDVCEKHPLEAIATIHLFSQGKYTILHAIHAAVVTTLICRALKLEDEQTRTLASAALTADGSIVKLTEMSLKQSNSLNPDQQVEFDNHPYNSLILLTRAGVRNDEWLDSVYMHHEHLDGSGFPRGLNGEEISLGARILAIADAYVSVILPKKALSQPVDSPTALRWLFKKNVKRLDTSIIADMIKYFGLIPPGTLVSLKRGGIGLVLMFDDEIGKPIIVKVGEDQSKFSSEFGVARCQSVSAIIRAPVNIPKRIFKLWSDWENQPPEEENKKLG